jgi:aminoglycoside phosphotransferase (APT) family kinase protein
MPGGASREIWLIETDDPIGYRLVLRRDPPYSKPSTSRFDEFRVMQAAHAAGVPVPKPIAYHNAGGPFGTAGFLMEYVEGEGLARRILRDDRFIRARRRLPQQIATALVRLRLAQLEFGSPPAEPVQSVLEMWQTELDAVGRPMPVVEIGLRWLRTHRPVGRPTSLTHGDFRLGNFIVDEAGLRAIVDWELWHFGDPGEDAAWLCLRAWRPGSKLRVGGLIGVDEFNQLIEQAGGEALTPDLLRYWEIFGNVKWAIICARQARHHLTGDHRSIELAVIGRRAAEAESDLLDVLGEGD